MSEVMHPRHAHLVDRTLTDLLSFIVDNRGRTCPVTDSGLPLIATNCIKPDQREAVFEDVRYVDDETYARWFRAHPLPGDVIFVCKGSPGRVAIVPDPVPYCIAQDMVALRADTDVIDPSYLYYRLSAPDVQAKIQAMHVGTLIPHFKKGDFGQLRFSVHENLDEQRRIAGVLSALDDLIEANRRILNAITRLSRVAFARCSRTARHEVALRSVAVVNEYKASVGTGVVQYLDIASLGDGIIEWPEPIDWSTAPTRARRLARVGDTLWSTVRPNRRAHALLLNAPDNLVVSTGIAVITPTEIGPAYLYAATDEQAFVDQLVSRADGSAYPAVRADAFETATIPLPSADQFQRFEAAMWPLWLAVAELQEEAQTASRARDELLPLLLTGRVQVRDGAA